MTNEQIRQLADDAANEAIRHIQDELGQKDGGFAGIYFSGPRWGELVSLLADYAAAEIMEGLNHDPL